MRYYIADLHLFHSNINDKLDKRGFANLDEMHEYIIKQHNSRVNNGDEVIFVGDLSFGNGEQTNSVLRRMNGKKFLVKGNHDHKFLNDPKFDKSLLTWVRDYAEFNDNGRRIDIFHYPILFYNGQYRKDANGKPLTYMISGHIHDTQDMRLLNEIKKLFSEFTFNRQDGSVETIPFHVINCFCMYSDYVPLTLDEWIAKQDSLGVV
jgi:calcineurin-like phosphoesterase family protein